MSQAFTAADLVHMQAANEATMLDTGNIQPVVLSSSSFGKNDTRTFPTDDPDTICGLDMRPGSERHNSRLTVTTYDATVRLPITLDPHVGDRFRITKRFGVALAVPLVFEIVSPIQRGPSGIRLLLQRIET